VRHDPVLRGLAAGAMGLAAMWGVLGATWLLYATQELHLDPALIGVIAALGGFGSLIGSLFVVRATTRFGIGPVTVVAALIASLATLLIPLAPAGLPILAVACLLGQQLVGDAAVTMFEVTEVSVRQARVGDRQLGRVNATVHVVAVLAQLVGTIGGGLLAEALGLRVATILAPLGALLGATAIWLSPVRRLRTIESPGVETN
ncbi:MAG: MFS transporter, partial [Chloroflexota bacterium]